MLMAVICDIICYHEGMYIFSFTGVSGPNFFDQIRDQKLQGNHFVLCGSINCQLKKSPDILLAEAGNIRWAICQRDWNSGSE